MSDSETTCWQQRKQLFLEALETPAEQRLALLAARCGDEELRADVESLLSAREKAATFLEAPAAVRVNETPAPGLPAGLQVAGYEIEQRLGEGAMGVVYRATQLSTRRVVALKFVRGLATTERDARRLQREAHTLGRLQHPGIAQVLDAGVAETPLGKTPYIAMELAQGEPITRSAQDRDLDTPARLHLFREACDAVHHAHLRGVVHRDLKPGHILVDDAGQVRIVDFGIARMLEADEAGAGQSQVTNVAGTLPYMAPEQFDADGQGVDHRADVYALGVVLYELLSSRRPIDVEGCSLLTAARRISEEEPAPLSRSDISLRGDLETIAAHALAKRPDDRYQSAGELAEEVERFLADLPLRHRPAGRLYLARKFIRRNRTLVLAVCAVVLAVALGVIGMAVTTFEARRAQRQADERFDNLRDLANALLFDVHDGIADLPGSTPVRARVAELGLKYLNLLEAGADDDPELLLDVARGLVRLGTVQGYHLQSNLGDMETSRTNLQRAQHLLEDLHARFPENVEIKRSLADAIERESGATNSPTQASLDRCMRVWDLRQALMQDRPEDPLVIADAVGSAIRVTFAARAMKLHDLQHEWLDKSIELAESGLATSPNSTDLLYAAADAHHWKGRACMSRNLEEARLHFEQAEELCRRLLESEPIHTPAQLRLCNSINGVAEVLARQGNEESLDRVAEAHELAASIYERDPQSQKAHRTWSIAHGYLGEALVALADHPDTSKQKRLEYLRRAIDAYRDYGDTLRERIERGWLYPWEQHYPEALADHLESLEAQVDGLESESLATTP